MPVAILYPRYDHPAVEERYASWQSQQLLRRGGHELLFYNVDESATDAIRDVGTDHVLVVTDPLLVAGSDLAERLQSALDAAGTFAAVPTTNWSASDVQQLAPRPYMTLRELELEIAATRDSGAAPELLEWPAADPGAYLIATRSLAGLKSRLADVLTGRQVIVSRKDFVHRWASMRGQERQDLLSRISTTARSILEFGCGEGILGAALKRRQKCRVVGIDIDERAAAAARERIDEVHCGDVIEIVSTLHEKFDSMVGGDIVEHLAEPWTFLTELRRIANPGGELLLSLPNIAHASIVADLLRGRFDYVYMGLTCAGHLRFFTRRSIEDMLDIAGWEVASIEPQHLATPGSELLLRQLEAAQIPFAPEDVLPSGFYVRAVNPG